MAKEKIDRITEVLSAVLKTYTTSSTLLCTDEGLTLQTSAQVIHSLQQPIYPAK